MARKRAAKQKESITAKLHPWIVSASMVVLPAAASYISQLTLAPSFGAIPSAVNHKAAILITFLLGFVLQQILPAWDRQNAIALLGVWIFCIPAIQSYILPFNSRLGPVAGPILHGLLSCHTIIVPSAKILAAELETLSVQYKFGKTTGVLVGGLVALSSFRMLEEHIGAFISKILVLLPTQTPVHLQVLLASLYTILNGNRKRKLVLLALPAILHTAVLNPHHNLARVNQLLAPHNWTLLERHWSTTGYISVLESQTKGYRLLRADHSLLGGEWQLTAARAQTQGWRAPEPVYAVFQLLEAVRLLQRQKQEEEVVVADSQAAALVVGLGVGTAPKALLAHGISTTVLELDAAVHRLAAVHFALPANHTFVHADAVAWVAAAAGAVAAGSRNAGGGGGGGGGLQQQQEQYDYILHDVFTGGAEPLPLFTLSFLSHLRALLRPDGVAAINYAGELGQPLTTTVLRTISHVFDGHCKAFRDSPAAAVDGDRSSSSGDSDSDNKQQKQLHSDFVNLVVFCRNSAGPIAFRKPTQADLLGSLSRKHYLYPAAEQEVALPSATAGGEQGLLLDGELGRWEAQQVDSATRHWRIMRGLLEPDIVWDLW